MIEHRLDEIASIYGLHPKHEHGGRVRFVCPHCGDTAQSGKKIKRTAHGWNDAPCAWWCYRCNEKGLFFDLYKAFGDEAPRDDDDDWKMPSKKITYKKPVSKPHINVAAGWSQLIQDQQGWDNIVNYCTISRGWPSLLAQHIAQHSDDICWAYGNSTIAKRAYSVDRPVLVALRDATGSVVNVSRRWAYDGSPSDGKPKAMVLSSKDTGGTSAYAGNMMCFGNIVEALESAKEAPLYIVEGGPDFLALQAMISSSMIIGSVIGAYNVTTMRQITDFIHDHLTATGDVLPKVVFIPHVNDTPLKGQTVGVGESTAKECAERLIGRAGVYMARIPAPKGVEADLADLIRHRGTSDTVACLNTAERIAEAPILLAESSAVIRSKMNSAVVRACSDGAMIIYQVDAGAGKSYSALGVSADVAQGKLQVKSNGKTESSLRSVVFATPSNELAEEKYKAFSMMFPDVPARMAYGAMHYCDFKDAVAAEFAVLGRRGVCGIEKFPKTLCPNFHSCDGSKMPETHRGEVLFTSHAMARRLQPDLTIIDEDCGIIQTQSVTQAEVISIFGNNSMQQSVKSWLNHINADAPAGAFYFNKMASDALSKNFSWTKTSAYDIRLSGMELFNLLSTNPVDLGSLLQGYDESATPPPKPLPNQVRSGWNLSKHLPSQRAYRALVELASAMRECMKPEDERNMFLANRVSLLLHTDFTWSLEVKSAMDLPESPVLVLDATGTHIVEQWESAITDRPVILEEVVVQGSAPASAIHINSKCFTRGLCVDSGQVDRHTPARVDSVLARLISEVRTRGCKAEGEHCTVAMLTHRPIFDACTGVADYPNAKATKARVDEIAAEMNATVLFGYYGRHDRGTNEFEKVDGLVVCGDPRGNLGDAEQDARLINVDLNDAYSGRTMATSVQAINRARHLRRENAERVVLMFVGDNPPEIRGFSWIEEEMSRRAYKTLMEDTLRLCRYIAQNDGILCAQSFKDYPLDLHPQAPTVDTKSVHPMKLTRAMSAVARELGWTNASVTMSNGRQQTVYAPTSSHAEAWRTSGYPVGFSGVDYMDFASSVAGG